MVYELINVILTIIGLVIALGGGVSGFIALYMHWKKSKAKLKIINTNAHYFLEKKNIIINAVVNVRNEKDVPVSITDLIASIRFDDDKKIKETPKGFSVSPIFPADFPININPNTSQAINLKFVFPDIDLDAVDRMGEARFIGIYSNTPVLVADERDFDLKWKELPLFLRLDFHVNGSENIKTIFGAYKTDKLKMLSGTFSSIDIGKIQHEFMRKK